MPSVSGVGVTPGTREPVTTMEGWAASWLDAGALERRLVDAAVRCIGRWGLRKTTLDDIAREAGVGRATVYRAFPGGKERLIVVVLQHEVGRLLHDIDAELAACESLDDLLTTGLRAVLGLVVDHPALRTLLAQEPEVVMPHVAFDRLDRVLGATTVLCRPYLARFLPDRAVAPAADWLARIVVSYAGTPSPSVDPQRPATIECLVRTYLTPGLRQLAATTAHPIHRDPTAHPTQRDQSIQAAPAPAGVPARRPPEEQP